MGCHRAQFWDQWNFFCICFFDTQLYISFKCRDPLESLTKLNMYISDIRVCMIKNKLKINDSKTEFIISRSPLLKQNLNDLSVSVGDI